MTISSTLKPMHIKVIVPEKQSIENQREPEIQRERERETDRQTQREREREKETQRENQRARWNVGERISICCYRGS